MVSTQCSRRFGFRQRPPGRSCRCQVAVSEIARAETRTCPENGDPWRRSMFTVKENQIFGCIQVWDQWVGVVTAVDAGRHKNADSISHHRTVWASIAVEWLTASGAAWAIHLDSVEAGNRNRDYAVFDVQNNSRCVTLAADCCRSNRFGSVVFFFLFSSFVIGEKKKITVYTIIN